MQFDIDYQFIGPPSPTFKSRICKINKIILNTKMYRLNNIQIHFYKDLKMVPGSYYKYLLRYNEDFSMFTMFPTNRKRYER